ncbi:hypothetical protein F2Q70_00010345 [Brassica cretica]|uniref:Uncharacterized protein n=1 Tax=Brassica cretica TaxID=69181 RepID=A0A8S9MBN0_BRACR|nr:hypothetical protein F2Q70_00010345 [Brassica cretica]
MSNLQQSYNAGQTRGQAKEKVEQWTESAKEIVHSARDKTANAAHKTTTTRKHRYSDDEYRRTGRRYLLGYFRWNGPQNHSERKEVSEYSDELWPSEYSEEVHPSGYSEEVHPSEYSEKHFPSEYSEEVYPSGYSEEICPRTIPRKLSSEYPEAYTSSEYFQK